MNHKVLHNIDNHGVATIILNRPEVHNALDHELITHLLTILQTLNNNPDVKVVVLSAAGQSFSAGADLKWMRCMATYSYEENIADARHLSALMETLKFLNQPTIARIQGGTYGGGVGLVACCDIAIASTEASFCLSEVKIGLIPAVISPYLLTAIGERATRRYCFTGEQISADEAYRLGLLTAVVPPEILDDSIKQIVKQILANSPQAIKAVKKLINRVSINPYAKAHISKNVAAIAGIRVSQEGQEGLTAFLEKRKPYWHSD